MSQYRVISSDNHIVEPPELWTSRIAAKYRDRCPRIERVDGGDVWIADGVAILSAASMGAQPGVRFEDPDQLVKDDVFEHVRLGAYIGEEAVKDMDIDGMDMGFLYPTTGLVLYFTVPDSRLFDALCGAYNDFVADFCTAAPSRLKGIAMLNVDDVATGVAELERCSKLGFSGAMIPVYPPEQMRYNSPEYDRLWAAAQDLEMPLSLHITTPRPQADRVWTEVLDKFVFANFLLTNGDYWVRVSLTDMILSGVFDRYPKLMVGSVEHELNWVPYFLERLDYSYDQRATGRFGYRLADGLRPSDVFHRNVFVDFQEDFQGIKNRDIIGVDNILWGSDYPHTESTWPRSRQFIEETMADCTEDEKAKMVGGNAARIYRL